MPIHSVLERQLRSAGFDSDKLPTNSVSWKEFLARIERSYTNADRQRQLLEQQASSPPFVIAGLTALAGKSDSLPFYSSTVRLKNI